MIPETRYTTAADGAHIAYQVVGEGPVDLVMVPDWLTHIEAHWEVPAFAAYLERLASFCRLIKFDQPGSGLSDPVAFDGPPTLEQYVDNVRSVLDAVGSERAALFSIDNSTATAVVFAATHPDRTSALILLNGYARSTRTDDYPWGVPPHLTDGIKRWMVEGWGSGDSIAIIAPSVADDPEEVRRYARLQRMAMSPGTFAAANDMFWNLDVRDVLPLVKAPTLVLHSEDNRFILPGHGHYLADHIPGARYVGIPSADHIPIFAYADAILGEVQEFLTGERDAAETGVDRVLATLLYTDIVGSTERAAEVGDARWRELLDRHDEMVRRMLERYRGREVKTTGDGFLATFDGPARAIQCAAAIRNGAERLGFQLRVGVHTGEVEVRGEDIGGIAANVGARVMREAAPGEIVVTSTVRDLVAGSRISFSDRGAVELRGVPAPVHLFVVEGG